VEPERSYKPAGLLRVIRAVLKRVPATSACALTPDVSLRRSEPTFQAMYVEYIFDLAQRAVGVGRRDGGEETEKRGMISDEIGGKLIASSGFRVRNLRITEPPGVDIESTETATPAITVPVHLIRLGTRNVANLVHCHRNRNSQSARMTLAGREPNSHWTQLSV
jgi:hypothetical protein